MWAGRGGAGVGDRTVPARPAAGVHPPSLHRVPPPRPAMPPNLRRAAAKLKALSKEVRGFSGRTRLPIYAAASICIRYDQSEPLRTLGRARCVLAGCTCAYAWHRGTSTCPRHEGSSSGRAPPLLLKRLPQPCPRPVPLVSPPPQNADRTDKMRALITGPEDTPYYVRGGAWREVELLLYGKLPAQGAAVGWHPGCRRAAAPSRSLCRVLPPTMCVRCRVAASSSTCTSQVRSVRGAPGLRRCRPAA